MGDFFRCIHCLHLYPRSRASVQPLPAKHDNPVPIGVCDRQSCVADHILICAKPTGSAQKPSWKTLPRDFWGTCRDCNGAVWCLHHGAWEGSWSWRCGNCGMRWREAPSSDVVDRGETHEQT